MNMASDWGVGRSIQGPSDIYIEIYIYIQHRESKLKATSRKGETEL